MARRQRRQHQQQVPGFRPGKEPPRLRKQHAKQQFQDLNAAQERLIDLFAERTPEESKALMRRWRIGLLTAGILLSALGVALYFWSVIAGIVVHVLAAIVFFLWLQMRRNRGELETMADMVSRGGGRGGKRR